MSNVLAVKLKKMLLGKKNDMEFVKGIFANCKTEENFQLMIEIIQEHPEATPSRLLLVSLYLGDMVETIDDI